MDYLTTERAKELKGKVVHCIYNDFNDGEDTFIIGDLVNGRLEAIDLSKDRMLYRLSYEDRYFIDDSTGNIFPIYTEETGLNWKKRICLKTGKMFPLSKFTEHLPDVHKLLKMGILRFVEYTLEQPKPHTDYYKYDGCIARGSGAERFIIKSVHDNIL